jgi:hypothetical protein
LNLYPPISTLSSSSHKLGLQEYATSTSPNIYNFYLSIIPQYS